MSNDLCWNQALNVLIYSHVILMLHDLFYYKKLKSNNLGKTKIKKLKSKISKKFKNLNKNSKEIKYQKQNIVKEGS